MQNATPLAIAVLVAELIPAAAFGLVAEPMVRGIQRLSAAVRILLPLVLVVPYVVVAIANHIFQWRWFALYAAIPLVIAFLLEQASHADPEQRGNWGDAVILLTLGLAVDLRWFDSAWPAGFESLGKVLLVDAGLYGFIGIRQLDGMGYDFRFHWSDWKTGLRELLYFAPAVLVLGLALGFIHPHKNVPHVGSAILRWAGIFAFIAVPEELFFRTWVQNLLERRMGRRWALGIASILFGLSHFNKRSAHFNWRYVILATIAGIFYGRAWRERRRITSTAITHTCVDWLWSWWF